MSRGLSSIVAALLLLVVGTLQAADDLLKVIPDSALGFMAVRGLSRVDGKLLSLAQEVGAQVPSPLAIAKMQSGIREGVDDEGSAAVVLFKAPGENAMPPVAPVILIPVTDYGKFIAQFQPEDAKATVSTIRFLGDASLVRKVGHYAAITGSPFREVLEKRFGGKGLGPDLTGWEKWLNEKDVELVLTRAGIKMGADYGRRGLEMLKVIVAKAPNTNAEAQQQIAGAVDIYGQMLSMLEKNVAVMGVGLDRDSAGDVRVTKRFEALPDSSAAKVLTESAPAAENLLDGLPAMPYAVAASATMTPDAMQAMVDFSSAFMKKARNLYHLSPEQVDQMLAGSKGMMKHFQGMAFVMGPPAPDKSLYSNFLSLLRTDDSRALLDVYPRYARDYNAAIKGADGPMGPMEVTKIQVEGLPALQITMDMSKVMQVPQGPDPERGAAMMKKMFGSEGKMNLYLVAVDKRTLLASYTNQDVLPGAIKALQGGGKKLAAQKGLARTAKLLPPTSCATGFISLAGTLDLAKWMVSAMGQHFPAQFPELPAMPPVGLAAWTTPGNLEVQMVVPNEIIKGIAQAVGSKQGK